MSASFGWVSNESAAGPGPAAARPELADVGRLLRRASRAVVGAARADQAVTLSSLLRDHLGPDCDALPVVGETWPAYEHVNVQTALDAWLEEPGRTHTGHGIVGHQHRQFGLADLLTPGGGFGMRLGNVARVNVASGPDGQVLPCVQCAVYLVEDGGGRAALLVRAADPSSGQPVLSVEVAAATEGLAATTASRLRLLATEHNVFRGQVLSFGGELFGHGETLLRFHRRTGLTAGALVLPPDTLAAVHRQVVEVARHKEQLLAAGQHLKRGLLLYGPPGSARPTPCAT